jgi:WD40 repeat protein
MRSRLIVLSFLAIGCKPAPPAPRASGGTASPEYAGVYQSTPDEDYFTPCGTNDVGDTWTLSFRDNEPLAPFLKKVTAVRGYGPLTHFIRFRGKLGAAGSYNAGFQTRQVEVDSILEVSESLRACAGYGVPAAWAGVPQDIRGLKGIALSPDRSLTALMDNDRQISIWSTARGEVLTRFPSFDKAGTRSQNGSPMTFSRDGQLLAVGMVDGLVRVWRTIDGKGLLTLRLKDSVDVARELAANPPPPNVFIAPQRDWGAAPKEIVFNKSGTMLATTNTFSTIVWSVDMGKRLAEFNQRNDFLSHTLFVGDSGLLMTADSGRMMFRPDLNAEPIVRPGSRSRTL